MSKIADALKKASRERLDTISPIRESNKFSANLKTGGKMRRLWLTWTFIIAVVAVFAFFNYQEGRDAVPLSEIFPDDEVFPVDIAYEFVEDEIILSEAEEVLPVIEESLSVVEKAKVAAPVVEEPVQRVASVAPAVTEKASNYTVQIASFKDKKRAEQALADIRIKVPSAYVASRNLGTKGTWYRVYAGQFELRNQAEVALGDIKQNFDSSFIISPKSSK